LSALDGEDGNGVWTLEITDDAGQDVGSLTNWSISITTIDTSEPYRTTGADGRFEFDFLPAGEHTVRQESQTGYTRTEPVEGFYTVTLSPAQQSLDLDFGNSSCALDSDLDNDLDTDRDDLVLLLARFGQSATPEEGDVDCDGVVALGDLRALQANLAPVPPPSAPASARATAADRVHARIASHATRRLGEPRQDSSGRAAQFSSQPEGDATVSAGLSESATRTLRARRQRAREAAISEMF
jgi:hypothetical protein